MKKFVIFFIFQCILISKLNASNIVYETIFYDIEINNEIIIDAKNREINRIKKLSLQDLLKKILIQSEYNKFEKTINLDTVINNLVLNIIIENEFIAKKIYKADIKINFDITELVRLFRSMKINYSDTISPNFLIIVAEKNKLSKEGLSINNSFYRFHKEYQLDLLKYKIPKLSPNDRFILPYEKVIQKYLPSLKSIAVKYETNHVFVVNLNKENNMNNFDINFFSNINYEIINIENISFKEDSNYYLEFYNYLNEWWKIKMEIDNSVLNLISCSINNSIIEELHYINSQINLITQIKENKIKKIQFGNNIYDISFYGNVNILIHKLNKNNIYLEIDSNNKCSINLIK